MVINCVNMDTMYYFTELNLRDSCWVNQTLAIYIINGDGKNILMFCKQFIYLQCSRRRNGNKWQQALIETYDTDMLNFYVYLLVSLNWGQHLNDSSVSYSVEILVHEFGVYRVYSVLEKRRNSDCWYTCTH